MNQNFRIAVTKGCIKHIRQLTPKLNCASYLLFIHKCVPEFTQLKEVLNYQLNPG